MSNPAALEAPSLLALEAREAGYKKRIEDLEGALQVAQELFAIVINPQGHPGTSTVHLWAQCTEIECKIRGLLQPKDGAK
jgi:hypothetical protein